MPLDFLRHIFGSTQDETSIPPPPPIFDAHKHISTFYEENVRLGMARRAELAEKRKSCLNLLRDGLCRLGEKKHREYRSYERVFNQGSYAMHTLNQHPKREYDIDVAVIFKEEDLPTTALKARQRVAEALRASFNNFATQPLARKNAVTAWYGEGQHVDLAVYREVIDSAGRSFLEHAGSNWTRRDPRAIDRWFFKCDRSRSPKSGPGVTVRKHQFRRVVRLVKAFARSRFSWQLPGGLILSALIAEVYQPHPERDDIALYETLVALQSRLRRGLDVPHPLPSEEPFTEKREIRAQVKELLEKLDFVLPYLEVLKSPACLESQALRGWERVFHHFYWRKKARQAELAELIEPEVLQFAVGLADYKEGPVKSTRGGSHIVVLKGAWLCFSLRKRLGIDPPFFVRWEIRYHGGEAIRAEDQPQLWWEASHEGRLSVICEIMKDGRVIARGVRRIRITSG